MPRRRYLSDDRRIRQRPHIKVHLSIANHPQYGPVFADPFIRGVISGIWVVGARAHISATKDELSLSKADACWITGTLRMVDAAKVLRRACAAMNYTFRRACDVHSDCPRRPSDRLPISFRSASETPQLDPFVISRTHCQRPARWVIGVRNFSRKQGFAPHSAIDSSAIQADYAASESEEPKNRSYAPRSQEEDRNGKMQNSDAFNKRLKDSASGNGSGKTWEEIDNEIRDNERKELLRQAGLNEQGKPIEDEEV